MSRPFLDKAIIAGDPRSCPRCGADMSRVIDTRKDRRGLLVRRRRCRKCLFTWGSIELYYDVAEEIIHDGKT